MNGAPILPPYQHEVTVHMTYVHKTCRMATQMLTEHFAQFFAINRKLFGGLMCAKCKRIRPIGQPNGEFYWADNGELV